MQFLTKKVYNIAVVAVIQVRKHINAKHADAPEAAVLKSAYYSTFLQLIAQSRGTAKRKTARRRSDQHNETLTKEGNHVCSRSKPRQLAAILITRPRSKKANRIVER